MVTAASALFRQLPVDQLRRLAFPLRPGCTQGQVKPWPQPCHQSIRTGRPDLSHALGALSLDPPADSGRSFPVRIPARGASLG